MEKGLVISSSGVRLAFEVAVLSQMVHSTNKSEEIKWTHVYGTSGGSLLSAFICMYKIGQENRALQDLANVVMEFEGESGMRSYFPFGIVQGLLWNKSMYNSSFIKYIVDKYIIPERIRDSGRHLHIVTVDYSTAKPREYTELHWRCIKDAIIASCSIPLIFAPHPIPDLSSPTGYIYCGDGGMTDFVPLGCALENEQLGHLQVIISVGTSEGRILDMAKCGDYPGIKEQLNTMMEIFYKNTSDTVSEAVSKINMLVFMKHNIDSPLLADMPLLEKRRIETQTKLIRRNTYITVEVMRPKSPLVLTPTGYSESISKSLWNAGIHASQYATSNNNDTNRNTQRLFIV